MIDVDEVLSLFVQAFHGYLRGCGHDLRLKTFSLFDNIYVVDGVQPLARHRARDLLDGFFTAGCQGLEPAPFAAEALARISRQAQVVILTAAPVVTRTSRAAWLHRNGFDYPLVFSSGDKGPEVAALAAAAGGPTAFVDDILRNLDSALVAAPRVSRFQLVADPQVRLIAPSNPALHERVEDWVALEPQLAAALFRDAVEV